MAPKYKRVLPTYALLMTALTFSISGLPGHQNGSSRSLSSEVASSYSDEYLGADSVFRGNCDVHNILDSGGTSASCSLNPRTFSSDTGDFQVRGQVKAEFKKVSRRSASGDTMVETDSLVITVTTTTSDGQRPITRTSYRSREDWGDINNIVADLYNAQAQDMSKKFLEHQKIVNCEMTSDGKSIETAQRPDCRLGKLSNMSDAQAQAYYTKYFKGDLERLLQSEIPAERQAGIQMLGILHESGIRSPYVQAALTNADLYAKYRSDMDRMEAQMANMTPEQRAAYAARLNNYRQVMNNEFRARGMEIDNKTFSSTTYNGLLADNLSAYTYQLNQHLDAIAQMHADVLNATTGRNSVRVGATQGQVSTGGGYQIVQPGAPVVLPQTANQGAPVAGRGTRGSVASPGAGIPQGGATVQIR